MENGIFSDPMVLPSIKKLSKVLLEKGIISCCNHTVSHDKEMLRLSSAAQKSTLQKLIYLTLVNYADLLTCTCTCGLDRCAADQRSILAKGVVSLLAHFSHDAFTTRDAACIWGETEEDTKRLALVSYCEAADLDGSDPILWLKIASTARQLGLMTTSMLPVELGEDQKTPTKFARLERYALERGLTTLPSNLPPNRCLSRAYSEHLNYIKNVTISPPYLEMEASKVVIEANLPNFSWAALGRLLIRVCKEGGSLGERDIAPSPNHPKYIHLLGSPALKIYVSSILTIPQNVLGEICSYLTDNEEYSGDLQNLENTCRTLSSAVASARTYSQRMKSSRLRKVEMERKMQLSQEVDDTCDIKFEPLSDSLPQNINRQSTRLRSQAVISGKHSELSAKRTSVRNALALITTWHSADHPKYLSLVEESKSIDWKSWCPFANEVQHLAVRSQDLNPLLISTTNADSDVSSGDHPPFSDESLSHGSYRLLDFLNLVNSNNAGPRYVLRCYLFYVSQNVHEVYQQIDDRGRITLSSTLLDCTMCFQTITFSIWYLSSYFLFCTRFRFSFDLFTVPIMVW
jgi:hypothetical protein